MRTFFFCLKENFHSWKSCLKCNIQTNNTVKKTSPIHSKWNYTKLLVKEGTDLNDHTKGFISTSPNFQHLIRNSVLWIDKSKLIEEILEDDEWMVYLITAPPQMGKTINLQMFAFYCQLTFHENGKIMNRINSPNYRYFTKGEIVHENGTVQRTFEPPLISNYKNNHLHLARYPVIHIPGEMLNSRCKNLSCFSIMISRIYQEYASLKIHLSELSKTGSFVERIKAAGNLNIINMYSDQETSSKLSEGYLQISIEILSKILNETYGSPVIIIYDKYDYFIQDTFFGDANFDKNATEKFKLFLLDFIMTTFETNKYLKKAIFTGVLPIEEVTTYFEINNTANNAASVFIFGERDLFPYYGIFRQEFDYVTAVLKIDETLKSEAISYYGGYRALHHLDVEMFSMYSVKEFLNNFRVDDYLHPTSLMNTITDFFKQTRFKSDMVNLMGQWQNESQVVTISDCYLNTLNFNIYEKLRNISHSGRKEAYSEDHQPMVFSFLLHLGLMSLHPVQTEYSPLFKASCVKLKIPNREIQNILQNISSRAIDNLIQKT
ncbi:uncharacterized protein LOC135843636 [Planococcus citri]|uniref:uncharacterized protein LOC135843636 n=1 Tax=Planococcus citri TaxID=170843 RepID=UPI0031F892D3